MEERVDGYSVDGANDEGEEGVGGLDCCFDGVNLSRMLDIIPDLLAAAEVQCRLPGPWGQLLTHFATI